MQCYFSENIKLLATQIFDYFSPNVAWVHEKYLQNFLFPFQTGLPGWIFQIWPKIIKFDHVLVYIHEKIVILRIFGAING